MWQFSNRLGDFLFFVDRVKSALNKQSKKEEDKRLFLACRRIQLFNILIDSADKTQKVTLEMTLIHNFYKFVDIL